MLLYTLLRNTFVTTLTLAVIIVGALAYPQRNHARSLVEGGSTSEPSKPIAGFSPVDGASADGQSPHKILTPEGVSMLCCFRLWIATDSLLLCIRAWKVDGVRSRSSAGGCRIGSTDWAIRFYSTYRSLVSTDRFGLGQKLAKTAVDHLAQTVQGFRSASPH